MLERGSIWGTKRLQVSCGLSSLHLTKGRNQKRTPIIRGWLLSFAPFAKASSYGSTTLDYGADRAYPVSHVHPRTYCTFCCGGQPTTIQNHVQHTLACADFSNLDGRRTRQTALNFLFDIRNELLYNDLSGGMGRKIRESELVYKSSEHMKFEEG